MRSLALRWMARLSLTGVILAIAAHATDGRADQIQMINGDRYAGRVVSLGEDTLVVQSEVLGTLKLPRSKISSITLSTAPAPSPGANLMKAAPMSASSNRLAKSSVKARTHATPQLTETMRQLNENSNLVQQVQQQLLGGAGPEAQTKFNDLLGGLLSGKMNMDDLRAEAKSTLAQARNARKELGDENGAMLDSYLAILDSFLKETEPTIAPGSTPTNGPAKAAELTGPRPLDGE